MEEFEHSDYKAEDLEIKSQADLEEAEKTILKLQKAVERYKTSRGKQEGGSSSGDETEQRTKDGRLFKEPQDDTAFIKDKNGSYALELRIIEHDLKPEIIDGEYDIKETEEGWEVRVGEMNQFQMSWHRLFDTNFSGGFVHKVVKPAVIRGREKEGKIIVDSVAKGILVNGWIDGTLP